MAKNDRRATLNLNLLMRGTNFFVEPSFFVCTPLAKRLMREVIRTLVFLVKQSRLFNFLRKTIQMSLTFSNSLCERKKSVMLLSLCRV
jgi:hypothetical protein